MRHEICDVVDSADHVIGRMPRADVHRFGLRHRAVHIIVNSSSGEVFLQRRAMSKACCPGLWDSSAAGHLRSGERYDEGARRELTEELGIAAPAAMRFLFKLEASAATGWEHVSVYTCSSDGPFRLAYDEIDRGTWFSPAAVDQWIATRPGELTGTLRLIWPRLPVRLFRGRAG